MSQSSEVPQGNPGRIGKAQLGSKSKDTKSLPWSWHGEEQPVYVVERRPYPEHEVYQIWVKRDGLKITSSELSQMLAQLLQSQTKGSDLAALNQEDK